MNCYVFGEKNPITFFTILLYHDVQHSTFDPHDLPCLIASLNYQPNSIRTYSFRKELESADNNCSAFSLLISWIISFLIWIVNFEIKMRRELTDALAYDCFPKFLVYYHILFVLFHYGVDSVGAWLLSVYSYCAQGKNELISIVPFRLPFFHTFNHLFLSNV